MSVCGFLFHFRACTGNCFSADGMIDALTELHKTIENLLCALELHKTVENLLCALDPAIPNRKHCLVLDFFSVPIFYLRLAHKKKERIVEGGLYTCMFLEKYLQTSTKVALALLPKLYHGMTCGIGGAFDWHATQYRTTMVLLSHPAADPFFVRDRMCQFRGSQETQ
jgi:hypothetical protein